MQAPIEPNKEDCCNSGCNPCIFDVYENQLKLYQKFLKGDKQVEVEYRSSENAISQLEYTEFILIKTIQICDSHVQLYFRRKNQNNISIWWGHGDHFLLKFISEHTTCTRAYTPLKSYYNVDKHDFTIIVKVYKNGLVSNYLNSLKPGSCTLWRGPYGCYNYVSNKNNRIIMIVQGTGIVAVIDIVEKIINDEEDMTKVILLYCCQNENMILFRDKLYDYKSFWNFDYKIFLSNVISKSSFRYQEPIIQSKLIEKDILTLKPVKLKDQIVLCGSPEFMKTYERVLRKEIDSDLNILLF